MKGGPQNLAFSLLPLGRCCVLASLFSRGKTFKLHICEDEVKNRIPNLRTGMSRPVFTNKGVFAREPNNTIYSAILYFTSSFPVIISTTPPFDWLVLSKVIYHRALMLSYPLCVFLHWLSSLFSKVQLLPLLFFFPLPPTKATPFVFPLGLNLKGCRLLGDN